MAKVEIGKKFIDLHKIIKTKNPKLYKRLPNFVIRIMERITALDTWNKYIYEWRDEYGLDWANKAISEFKINVVITGIENLPKTGNQMVVANHPLGGFDGIAMLHVLGKTRPDVKAPVNDILLNLPGLAPILVPIDKHGRNVENIKILNKSFESDDLLLFFPAGLVSRKQKGGIKDLEWKHTFIKRAVKYQRDVIPVYIKASNTKFFYNLGWFRKLIGMKANIEMILLPGEVPKQYGKTIEVHFGELITYQTFDKSKSPKKWAKWVKDIVYKKGAEIEKK
ncbi:MAG: 1-acyl-sn-glycerol-3-phosphate acyltransferase [Bacteroidales bacterium]|nr:1-acyl-sn-glycerol-3-phosphate acyltransferase [Bacteroidales bacterium]